jgi:hypothetical protein
LFAPHNADVDISVRREFVFAERVKAGMPPPVHVPVIVSGAPPAQVKIPENCQWLITVLSALEPLFSLWLRRTATDTEI